MIRIALVSILALVSPAHLATAETITVCASGCDYTSINAAIAAASDGDVIQLAAETYSEGEVVDTHGKAITIAGTTDEAGNPTSVLDGNGSHRVIQVLEGVAALMNIVIQNGNSSGEVYYPGIGPGALLGAESGVGEEVVRLENVLSRAHRAGMYGGVFVIDAFLEAYRCRFEESDRCGLFAAQCPPAIIEDCHFVSNSGCGLHLWEMSASILRCRFESNALVGLYLTAYGQMRVDVEECDFCSSDMSFATDSGDWEADVRVSFRSCRFSESGRFSALASCHPKHGGCGLLNSITDCVFETKADYILNWGNPSTLEITNSSLGLGCQVVPPKSFVDLGGNDYDPWCDDCRANIDCRNDAVDAEDLGYLLGRWGTDDPQSDIDGDGLVTASDLGFLFAAWGPCN